MGDSKLIRACGLWRGVSKAGTDYLSGKLTAAAIEALGQAREGDRLFVFKNKNRRDDRDPEYQVQIAPAERPESQRAPKQATRPRHEAEGSDDDIPF